MKFVDEFRDPASARTIAEAIAKICTQPWTIMEVCGGQTHAIKRFGIDQMLPGNVHLLHGPGCPVCVTPASIIDKAMSIARNRDTILCSFGDMLRVPGSGDDLLRAKADGADIRMVYSPLDAVKIAREHPQKEVVFFAVGFETTAPAAALAVLQADKDKLSNFSLLVSHVLVPPAIEAILASDQTPVQGFLAAGHVCTVMGEVEYRPIVDRFKVPIVITGFEPVDILQGIYLCLAQLESGQAVLENQYSRSVRSQGNQKARQMIEQVFQKRDFGWRGIGLLEQSGLQLTTPYRQFDAELKFELSDVKAKAPTSTQCISGEILQGLKKPTQCPAFGNQCTPEHPLGATMVSGEGACQAYFRYR